MFCFYVCPSKPIFWSTYQNGRCQSASAFWHYTFEHRGTWSNCNILEVPVRVSAHRAEWYNGNAPDLYSEGVWLISSTKDQLSRILRGFPLLSPGMYSISVPFNYVIHQSTPGRRQRHSLRCWQSWNKQERSNIARTTDYSDRNGCDFTQSLHTNYEILWRNECQMAHFKSLSSHYAWF